MLNYVNMDAEKVDLQKTVSLLGVSSATVKNWIKHDYLTPEARGNEGVLVFDYSQVKNLKENLDSGKVSRLNSRANKSNSSHSFIPEEYIVDEESSRLIRDIIHIHDSQKLSKESTLLGLILNLLGNAGLVDYQRFLEKGAINFKSEIIKNEIDWWLNKASLQDRFVDLLGIKISNVNDILGLVHQSLSTEGSKAQAGSYYTPKQIVDEIVGNYIQHDSVVLDPCCGTGQFLLSASQKIEDPMNIWGFDIDEVAVRIARINLLLRFPEKEFSPNIYHRNTLLDFPVDSLFSEANIPKFDAVLTNPPWGVHFSSSEVSQLQAMYPEITSGEAFSYFLARSVLFLKEQGVLSFILPESILNVQAHKDIRRFILHRTNIRGIKHLDRVFDNVFTPVIRLDLEKGDPLGLAEFHAEKSGKTYTVKQHRLVENSDYIFDVFNGDLDINIFEKIYGLEHTTLKGNADWALGIVTGDNKKYLLHNQTPRSEAILTGKDIKRFRAIEPKSFIEFEGNKFQQVAPEHKYRAKEKLIYKFISKDLVFSYDDKQTLTLNSANILIPRIANYPTKTILALFNSSPYQFLFQKKFNSIKILRSDLEKMPLPILTDLQHAQLVSFTDLLLQGNELGMDRKQVYLELDSYIMDNILGLSQNERTHLEDSIKSSDKLLAI